MDKEKIKNILIKKMPENQVFIDEPMSKHTSFKIGGNADFFIKIKRLDYSNLSKTSLFSYIYTSFL